MEEILNPNNEIPETTTDNNVEDKKEEEIVGQEQQDSAQSGDHIEAESPAEMSLEGRKAQLEEKVSAQLGSESTEVQRSSAPADVTHAAPAHYPQITVPEMKPKMPQSTKAYIGLIVGLLVVFIFGFVLECARTYRENGLFGGDLDRFLDTDFSAYDPFGGFDGEEEATDSDALSGFDRLFPFHFGDSDLEPFLDDSDDIFGSDGDRIPPVPRDSDGLSDKLIEAPAEDNVINEAAANLAVDDQPDDIDEAGYTAAKAYKKVMNSVVNVVLYSDAEHVGSDTYKEGSGSGIIVSKDGYVITNSHVIDDKHDGGIEIITTEGDRYAAAVVGFDTRSDLAVLKIDAKDLKPAEFVNSDQIVVGQDAIAVGNPGGVAYSNSLTRGCVSALNRTVPSNTMVSYIQTDAAINPGNSGGPLLNSAGQVMGITTIKIANTDYEGMGFAIPSNTVIEIANSIIARGYVGGRVMLGILATQYAEGDVRGIEILEINDGSPLKGTDAAVGDVITEIDGEKVSDFTTLYQTFNNYQAGDEARLTLYRPKKSGKSDMTFSVIIKFIADEGQ